jgi:outer membrane protein TolC
VVDWNLFDGGKTHRTADAERTRAAGLRCLVEDLKSQIALDLLDASSQVAEAAERVEVAAQNIAHTAERLRVARERYGRGIALNSEVLEAQADWTESMRDLHHATYLRVLAQLRMRYFAGLL